MSKNKNNNISIMTADQLEGRVTAGEVMTADQLESTLSNNSKQRSKQWKRQRTQQQESDWPTKNTQKYTYDSGSSSIQKPTVTNLLDRDKNKTKEKQEVTYVTKVTQPQSKTSGAAGSSVFSKLNPKTFTGDSMSAVSDTSFGRPSFLEDDDTYKAAINDYYAEDPISALENEIAALEQQGTSILQNSMNMNRASAEYAEARDTFNAIREQVDSKKQQLEQLKNAPMVIDPVNEEEVRLEDIMPEAVTPRQTGSDIPEDDIDQSWLNYLNGQIGTENANMEEEDIEDDDLLSRLEGNTKINGENGEKIRSLRNEISALESEITALNEQGTAINNSAMNMNMASAEFAAAREQFQAINEQLQAKQQQVNELKAQLEPLEREEALANNKYMPEIMGKYGSTADADGHIVIGGKEIEIDPYSYYEGTEKGKRGEVANDLFKFDKYMGYQERNPFAQYSDIAGKGKWQDIEKDAKATAEAARAEMGNVNNLEDVDLMNTEYLGLIDYLPGIVNLTQEEYDANPTKYDRILYNYHHGYLDPNAYDENTQTPYDIDIKEDPSWVEEQLQEYWQPLESGKVKNLDNFLKYREGLETTYATAQSWYRTAQKNVKKGETQEENLLSYTDLIDANDDNLDMAGYNPQYDRSSTEYRQTADLNDMLMTDDVHKIYSLIGHGNEWDAFTELFQDGEVNVSPAYSYALMMLTGEGGGENEVAIFQSLYNQAMSEGREPTEAKAFLDGLQPTLRARYSDAEKIGIAEFSRKYPVVATAASLYYKQINTYVDAARHLAHLFGDASTEDPESKWYYFSRYEETALNTIAKDISEQYGDAAGKAYISSIEGLSNLVRALSTPAGSDKWNEVAGLLGMFFQVDQEATYKYLSEDMSYTEASYRAFLDAAEEICQEFLPYETMLKTKNMGLIASEFANILSEMGQEVTGATVGEAIKGALTGESSRQDRIDEIVTQQGYYGDDGKWIDLSYLSNNSPDLLLDIARQRESAEHTANIGDTAISAAVGAVFPGAFGTMNRMLNYKTIGKDIRTDSTKFTYKKAGTETTATEEVTGKHAKADTGEAITGKHAQKTETGEQSVIKGEDTIGKHAKTETEETTTGKHAGKDTTTESETTEKTGTDMLIATAGGMEGTKSQKLAREIEEKRAKGKEPTDIDIGRLASTMAEESNESIKAATYDTVRNRVYGQMKNQVKNPIERGELADAMARTLTSGKMTRKDRSTLSRSEAAMELYRRYNTVESQDYQETVKAVEEATAESRSVAQTISEVTGTAKTAEGAAADEVNRSNMKAGGDVEAAIDDFAIRRSDLMSEEYAAEAKAGAKTATNKKSYLADAVSIRIHAFSGSETAPKTSMDSETANKLWVKAREEYTKAESERVKNQAPITPGKGTANFEGAQYGTDGWTSATDKLDKTTRRTVNAIAWIAKQTGNTVNFVNRNTATVDKNGKITGGDVLVHGWESNRDGSITINVAGLLRSGARKNMMTTIAHEMTHWLEQNSSEGYAALRRFLLKNLRERGMNIEQRMVDLIDNQNSVLGPDSKEQMNLSKAMAEIVAQSCEELMTSKEMITKLAGEEPGAYEKVAGFIRKLWNSITANMTDSLSDEAKLLRDVKDEIAKYWLSARDEALGRKGEGTADNKEEETQFSVAYNDVIKRDKDYFDNILTEHPYITITEIRNPTPVTKNAKGYINASNVVQNAISNPYTQTAQHGKATPRNYAFVPDLGIRVEIAGEGIKHGFKRGKQIKNKTENAMLAQYASEILQNAVEVNRGIAHQDTAAIEHVMVAGVRVITGNSTEDYGLRIVIHNPKNKQPELERLDIIGILHSLNEEKTVLNSLTGNNAARASGPSFQITLSKFFDDVKNELDDVFADDVYTNKGTTRTKTVFSDNLAYSVAQMDQDYMDAVKSGDVDAQQYYVNQAAERAGYDINNVAYHGTEMFGFTKFDMSAGRDTIFVAYNKTLAATYMRTDPEVREISDRNGVPLNPYVMNDKDLTDLFKRATDRSLDIVRIENNDDHDSNSKNAQDEFKVIYKDDWTGEQKSTKYRRFELWQTIDEWQNPNGEYDGMYELYTRPGNQLVVDAMGRKWNELEFNLYGWKNRSTDIEDEDWIPTDWEWDEDFSYADFLNGFIGPNEYSNTRKIAKWAKAHGYDSVRINNVHDNGGRNYNIDYEEAVGDIGIFFNANDVKSADPVTYDDQGEVIPVSERFNPNEGDIRYSVAQLAQANGMRFDEDEVVLYNAQNQKVDGVRVKVTEDMIEKTPIGMLINMARDGVTTKGGKVKFKPTISAKTAAAQKKMFTDLMNMVARYKDSNLVWEIAGSTLYSALKSNSDPQYSTTVDFGTVCAKTQEIINVMSRVMLEKGRGLTREEVLDVYNQTANAGLTVPCPVCYVFSRWMGVPSLLNQMSQYQKRFVVLKKDGSINVKKTQKNVDKYIHDAMDEYGDKATLDKAKTSIMNRMKTQETNRSDALVIWNSKTATAEEKAAAKEKHDKAIKELDSLQKELGKVEAYNWVTQALCKETGKNSGKYVVDPAFELTPDSVLFDLRKTGEFAKYTKNWRYRNTRGAGMGKAIMPYSGMSIGDIIFGTERKSDIKNPFLQMKAGAASNGIKNAIARARKQNLIGGQRLQSTSDYRPEWGLDYLMTFLELQAIGSKVQMYTKVAEAVDLLASMQADVNLSIMGKGNGYHIATAQEIRESRTNEELRSRMGRTYDEEGNMQTYVLDFSDVTGMEYNTAKALTKKHHNVQMILVGMNDIHIRLAMANPDIDFIIPWHSSGNSQDALKSMIASAGEQLETSHNYEDSQTDTPREDQTAEQKKLWELRLKIIQGKVTAEDKKSIEKDDILQALYNRFYVEGVDPDCYQVQLGAEQAKQIFPYEYWDKSLTKAEADGNGQRFIEYCEHFGIRPRFYQFADQQGYWKVLIDRKMYDNDGNYREQKVVDVTKAKIGSLDKGGKLQGSDMPLQTSAMYGDRYSKQEKDAVDNTIAVLDEKARIQAIGTNVTEEEAPRARNNQSAFGASAGVAAMDTTAISGEEVIAPAKRRARYVDEEESSFSVAQPGMDVRSFMMGLNEASLESFQEKAMLRQFKEMNMARDIANMELIQYRNKLRELEAKENPSAFDREEMRKARNRITNAENKLERAELALDKATQDKGFANLMHKNERLMKGLVGGRTIEDVQKVIETLTAQVEEMSAEMEKRQKKIDQMRADLTQRKRETLVNENSARRMAGIIKKEYSSDMDTGELVKALTEIRLKIQAKENIDQDVEDLAWRIAQGTRGEESAVINALRGRTIVLGPSQMAELKGQHRTIRDVRSDLAGTGIKVTTGNTNTLDSVWKQICILAANLDPETNSGDQLDALLSLIKAERKAQTNADMFKNRENMDNVVQELKAMIAAVDMNVPKDPAAMEIINRMNRLMNEMEKGSEESAEELRKARNDLAEIVDAGNMAVNATEGLQRDIKASIQYNNALAEQSEAALWKNEKFKIIQQLKDKNTEALIKEQQKWKERIERDKTAREKMNENMHIRKMIHRNITRLKKLIINETDLENVPEYMKSLAREVLTMITNNDLGGMKITGIDRKDLIEMQRVLSIMNAQDGRFTEDDLRVLGDAEAQSVIMDALADIEDGITLYNSSTKGRGILENLDMYHTALDTIEQAVATIKTIIDREREISIGDRKILVADAAAAVATDARASRFKGELKGPGSKQLNAIRRTVIFGNLTPVYFFKQLKNRGMNMQWDELRRAENRNGLELQKAAAKIAEIAEKYHYKDWADKKTTISIYGKKTEITYQQIMSLYAIWKREKSINPEMSSHLEAGGVYFEEPETNTEGKLRREKGQQKPVKMKEDQVMELYNRLSDEQKAYLDEIVGYLSSDMSELGNEASMRMYGIKKYKEAWYFPMMIWDGVKSARSDKGISGTTENRAAHKGWSKRRKNNASNALVIKDFTDVAVGHIVEMINYNTVAPAIENINKVLNYQFKEQGDEEGAVRRNTRVIFQQAYGRDALNYLETFLQDLNGGTVQDQRKTLRESALSMFKKNAVAGSLSVALQQPLSYIRAAMMISPTALAQALSPEYWKGSYAEMMKYSGVAVIKDMGRFDMNYGRSARDFIAPEKNETILAKASDKMTATPEAMDRMTWTRMWSACKIEQHRKNPDMDMQSDEFLQKVAERFNDVMQHTQVYDSVMVKSQNMRSDKFTMKMLTSFMAEPTLSLNVLADAIQNINTAGGKTIAAKAGATFILGAIMQSMVKALVGSGRTPDDKKTRGENFLYKWFTSFLSEADPLGLIPGFSDIVELIRNGKLTDDAMSVIGKMFASIDTANKVIQGEGKGWWRDVEDTAGQIIQLFTDIPMKNLMRDGRAMYNWITQEPYAKRETSGAVLRKQSEEAFWTSDSLLGAINAKLGEAGFRTTNTAYYGRLFDAMRSGNKTEEQEIREYLTLGKGVTDDAMYSGIKAQAKAKLPAAEASQWMIENDMMDNSSTLTTQYKKGEITKEQYKKLLKEQNPKMTDDEIFWKVDEIDYQKETKTDKTGKYLRLWDAMNGNSATDISKAITTMTSHGVDKKNIKSQITSHYKQAYLDGNSSQRRTILDAMQKAYKKLGYTAEDASKIVNGWTKDSKKKK